MNATHGGKRPGAGRPRGSGKFMEATVPIRVPESLVDEVREYIDTRAFRALPLYSHAVAAGTLTSADSHIEGHLNLAAHLAPHPESSFLVRARGDSMVNAGIYDGDLLVVDSSLEAKHGKVVIAAVDGDLTVKRLCQIREKGRVQTLLLAENEKYAPIEILEGQSLVILGVVTQVIHEV